LFVGILFYEVYNIRTRTDERSNENAWRFLLRTEKRSRFTARPDPDPEITNGRTLARTASVCKGRPVEKYTR